MHKQLSRRSFLTRAAVVGCSAAASPLMTTISYASAPWDNRLVVIILRGGMDGLDVLRPYGDPLLSDLRPTLVTKQDPTLDLDGFYGLHPAMRPLLPLWRSQELAFVQAVSQPYRDKRSHFDGQDLLEAGVATLQDMGRDGWLNRLLQDLPGSQIGTAYSVGAETMLLTQGDAPVSEWSPDVDISLSAQGVELLNLTMRKDPALAGAMAQALILAESDGDAVSIQGGDDAMMMAMKADMQPRKKNKSHLRIADFAAAQLAADARIVSFSLGGWDTHARQGNVLKRPLAKLSDVLLRLKDSSGPKVWGKTTVVAMTEFGRTVRENGSRGTDHGTGGAMILAGGALRGGRVYGGWPGLDEADLYQRRDLMPLDDVRRYAAWAMRDSFGVGRSELESRIFPGLDLGDDPHMLL